MSGKRKTPSKSPPTRQGKNGGTLLSGNPGNKGGTGRPPEAFRDFLKRMREKPEVLDAFELALLIPGGKGYASALKVLTDYDEDKPAEKKQLQGKFEVSVRFVRE